MGFDIETIFDLRMSGEEEGTKINIHLASPYVELQDLKVGDFFIIYGESERHLHQRMHQINPLHPGINIADLNNADIYQWGGNVRVIPVNVVIDAIVK